MKNIKSIEQFLFESKSTAKKRFLTFQDTTLPIINYYKDLGMLIEVKGDQDIESVFVDCKKVVTPYIEKEIILMTQNSLLEKSELNKNAVRTFSCMYYRFMSY
jgi:hypothetical protein